MDKGMWMDAAGEVVPIRELSAQQLLSSALALRDANYDRIGARVKWVGAWPAGLMTDPILSYPTSEMTVGTRVAGVKLDEFYKEALRRWP